MKQAVSLVGAIALTVALFVGRPVNVSAHAEYDHSEPAKDATVTAAPTMVKVWFTEGVQLRQSSLMVHNAAGQQVDLKDAKLDPSDSENKIVVVSLMPNLPAGAYKVEWKTVSAEDGDEDEGDFSFTIRAAAAAPAPAAAAAPPTAVAAAPAAQASAPAPKPAAQPAAQPSPSPRAVAQVPGALPRTGSAEPDSPLLWIALGSALVLVGVVVLRRVRAA
jgi:LPXTG-motif cell wall-anchored protein